MSQETITQIPLVQLLESPFNPRKVFTGLDELAASIKAEGRVHEPLLVRPRVLHMLKDHSDPGVEDGYEIVFGHRRLRAAEQAGLTTVPCMVRAMSDAEARSAQTAENLQREDVHPIEEAEGFQSMIQFDGVTADELAELVGKSRSHVYGRLKLLQACPQVRQACLEGKIGSEVALLIARLRTPRLQEKALAAIHNDTSQAANLEDGGKRSFRHIRDMLAEKFTLSLKGALFDREDDTLLPGAGVCSTCPKRTANAPEFEDLAKPTREGEHRHYTAAGGPDVCTDPDCFDAKKVAHLAREATRLQAEGKTVVAGSKARAHIGAYGDVKGAYLPLDKVKGLLKKAPKKGSAAAQDVPQPAIVHIQNPRDGKVVKAVKRADLEAAGLLKPETKLDGGSQQARQEAQRRQQEANDAKAKAKTAARMHLLQHMRQIIAARPRDAFDLRLVAAAAFAGVNYHDRRLVAELHDAKDDDALKLAIDTMSVAQLEALIMDCAIVDNVRVPPYNLSAQPLPLLALAEHYGVDAKAVMRESAQPAPTPSPAGASANKGGAGAAKKATTKTKASPAAAGDNQRDGAGFAGGRDASPDDLFAEAQA
jgi:ParB/RepB/Spo0J family partition protein